MCQTVDVLSHFQLERFVLESDSPYLCYLKGVVSHHSLVCELTKAVAIVLEVLWEQLLSRSAVNTNILHKIQFKEDCSY